MAIGGAVVLGIATVGALIVGFAFPVVPMGIFIGIGLFALAVIFTGLFGPVYNEGGHINLYDIEDITKKFTTLNSYKKITQEEGFKRFIQDHETKIKTIRTTLQNS